MQVFRHEILRAARLELGLTQEQTAQALGIDVRTYRRYEAGSVNDAKRGFSVRRAGRRQLLARIGEELGIAAEELVGPAETPAEREPALPLGHVLPPARSFVGRDAELERLRLWSLSPHAPRVLSVVAMGGAGKSSLVQHWLDERNDNPLVWSFYDSPRAEGFLASALAWLTQEATPASSEATLERLLAEAAKPNDRIVVLDGFEVMQSDGRGRPRGSIEDPLLRRLLTTLAAREGGMRVLVTSRVPLVDLNPWDPQGAQSIALEPLSDHAQRELLRGWGVEATDAELGRALERFGGHALSVSTLASLVMGSYDGDLSLLGPFDLGDTGSEDPHAHRLGRLLETYAAAMSDAQRDLLARVAAFPRGVRLDTLCDLAKDASLRGQMPSTRRALVRELSRLEVRGLVHRDREASSRYGVHPFVGEHFRQDAGLNPTRIHDSHCARIRTRLDERPDTASPEQQLDLLEELLVHTLLAGHAREAFALYHRAFGGFTVLGLERGDMVRGARLLRGFLEDDDPQTVSRDLLPWQVDTVLYEQALYASAMGDPAFALACLRHHVEATAQEPRSLTTGLRTTAYVLRLMGRFDEALAAIERAWSAAPCDRDHRARNLALEAAIHHDRGDFATASKRFLDARDLDPAPRFRRALWEAEHELECGNVDHALALVTANRRACVRRGWPGHVSHCDTVIGRCLAERDPDAADVALGDALHWAHASGEVEARLRCFELELMLRRNDDTYDDLQRNAVALVDATGLHRFDARLRA